MGQFKLLSVKRNVIQLLFYIFIILILAVIVNTAVCLLKTVDFSLEYSPIYAADWTGLALLYSGIVIGIIIIILADVKTFFYKIGTTAIMFFFFYAIWLFVNEANILNLFLYYELFLLPSFFIVYFLSPNRRSIMAAIYFLTWTQFGSLLVLVGLLRLYNTTGVYELSVGFTIDDTLTTLLVLLGFGIKIPMWPFYYWLTKTHVEASSFFSIYLSGFLVKTAVYLFIKFYSLLNGFQLFNIFFALFVVGVVDSSIKMWHQTDLKKLIAFTTVQEMNLLVIPILFNDYSGELVVSLFIVTHCLLSSLLFFFIDVLTKRFATRSSTQITGLVHLMPSFSFFLFLTWLGFSGLPYTIKFTLELHIFTSVLTVNGLVFAALIIGMNVIGLVGFSKNLFNALFGAPIISEHVVYDLNKRESLVFIFLLTNLVGLNLFTLLS